MRRTRITTCCLSCYFYPSILTPTVRILPYHPVNDTRVIACSGTIFLNFIIITIKII